MKKKYEELTNEINRNSYFYFFVQLNDDTAELIDNNNIKFYFINNKNSVRPKDYIDSLFDENYEKDYLTNLKNDFELKLSKCKGIDRFTKILNAKYLSKTKGYKSPQEIIEIYKIFSEFFTIYCRNKEDNIIIENIEFINKRARDFFNDQYNSIICESISQNNLGIFDNIIYIRLVSYLNIHSFFLLKIYLGTKIVA